MIHAVAVDSDRESADVDLLRAVLGDPRLPAKFFAVRCGAILEVAAAALLGTNLSLAVLPVDFLSQPVQTVDESTLEALAARGRASRPRPHRPHKLPLTLALSALLHGWRLGQALAEG